ncbi:benenodin family lasso peptide [Novosphingobium terrae]|nr:benenodin family lasso peptide [Novosphingobium terrae]
MTHHDELIDLGTASSETQGGAIPVGDELLGRDEPGLSDD